MMNLSYNHPLRRSLIKQLIFIDHHKLDLIRLYFSSTPVKEKNFSFFSHYILKVENFLRDFDYSFSPKLNIVFIGSEVTLLYVKENYIDKYTICLPEQSNPNKGYVSFLSPLGRQLLLRVRNEPIILSTPNGEAEVMIKDIEFKQYC